MRILLVAFLWTSALMEQHPRDSWKLRTFAKTPYSLADAPLSSEEREQIYRAVDQEMRLSDTGAGRDQERQEVMSSLVGGLRLRSTAVSRFWCRDLNHSAEPLEIAVHGSSFAKVESQARPEGAYELPHCGENL